jgi:uncharacterized coiled-coil protein SlyX
MFSLSSLLRSADAFSAVRERTQLRQEVDDSHIAKAEYETAIDDLNRTVEQQAREMDKLKKELAKLNTAKPKTAASFGRALLS